MLLDSVPEDQFIPPSPSVLAPNTETNPLQDWDPFALTNYRGESGAHGVHAVSELRTAVVAAMRAAAQSQSLRRSAAVAMLRADEAQRAALELNPSAAAEFNEPGEVARVVDMKRHLLDAAGYSRRMAESASSLAEALAEEVAQVELAARATAHAMHVPLPPLPPLQGRGCASNGLSGGARRVIGARGGERVWTLPDWSTRAAAAAQEQELLEFLMPLPCSNDFSGKY